ncbi:hypothetical protein [uncultured Pseudoteredinibacter sp.]|uniref:hypothetical protein n=1 Tax=uncultured Pseudoteredinibacter sp. TaxID=1641701 RepID=UPI00262AAEFB|nr:hypothetical protein [uncultured Pseudoteredinibacter sp.]
MKRYLALFFFTAFIISPGAMATQYIYTWSTTTNGGSTGDFSGPAGRPVVVSITLDNGGTTNINQTWTSAQIVEVSFSLSGNILSSMNPSLPGHTLTATPTSILQSDGAGDLSVMPNSISGALASQVSVTPGSDTDPVDEWYINAANGIYFSDLRNNDLSVANVIQNNSAASWQQGGSVPSPGAPSAAQAVPTFPAFAVFLLSLIIGAAGARAHRRKKVM